VDWRVYHAINEFVADHSWLGRLFHVVETYGTILIAIAAFALWLLARPGGDRKW
jgi:predicted small integral membrane protein